METRKILTILVVALGLMVASPRLRAAELMGCAFTYQGRLLEMSSPAEGEYDFQFKLYDAPIDGNQVDGTVDINEQWVSDGYFTVLLDFGCEAFNGERRWLEAGVRPGEFEDPNTYITLIPRQEVTPTPYAIYAATAEAGGMQDAIVRGFEIADTNNDDPNVTIRPGVAYHGTTKVTKTANTTLTFATASDWYDGSTHPYSGGAGWCYIGYDSNGNIRLLANNPPDVDDSGGNNVVDATKYYFDDSAGTSGEYWRVIAAVRVDTDDQIHANGAGFQRENIWMYDVPISLTTTVSAGSWTSQPATTAIPATSTFGLFGVLCSENATGSARVFLRPTGSTWSTDAENSLGGTDGLSGSNAWSGQRWCATNTSQSIDYQNQSGDDNTAIDVEGFMMNIR
jgi:hypothetical protein